MRKRAGERLLPNVLGRLVLLAAALKTQYGGDASRLSTKPAQRGSNPHSHAHCATSVSSPSSDSRKCHSE